MPNRWIISLLATGAADFLENSLVGIWNSGIDMTWVHVVVPRGASDDVRAVVNRFGARLREPEELLAADRIRASPVEYADYGTAAFNDLMRMRLPLLQALSRECDYIIHADIDIAWLANPLPYLEAVLAAYPMAFQTEAFACFPPNFCCGFFAMQTAAAESGELIQLHIDRFSEDCPLTMQVLLNSIIQDNPKFLASIFPLPEALFANGLLHSTFATRHINPCALIHLIQPFTFHANFTIGGTNKRRLLREAGVWFADPATPLRIPPEN